MDRRMGGGPQQQQCGAVGISRAAPQLRLCCAPPLWRKGGALARAGGGCEEEDQRRGRVPIYRRAPQQLNSARRLCVRAHGLAALHLWLGMHCGPSCLACRRSAARAARQCSACGCRHVHRHVHADRGVGQVPVEKNRADARGRRDCEEDSEPPGNRRFAYLFPVRVVRMFEALGACFLLVCRYLPFCVDSSIHSLTPLRSRR